MRVLIDTNVILDFLAKREPHIAEAREIVKLCTFNEIEGCIAAHSVTDLFYILRKNLSVNERKAALLNLCRVFTVVSVDAVKLVSALEKENFNDLEDCLQDECASEFEADYLITRNLNDFKHGKVKAVHPSKFLSEIKK